MKIEDIIKICGVKSRMLGKSPELLTETQKLVKQNITEIIPKHIICEMKDTKIIRKTAKLWQKIPDYRLIDCKLAILDCSIKSRLKNFNSFICETEKTKYEGLLKNEEIILPEIVCLSINNKEILITNPEKNQEIVDILNLTIVINWGYDENGISLLICKDFKEQNLLFNTKQAPFIDFLLKGYTKILAKKDIIGMNNRKSEEKEQVPYNIRSSYEYIEKQKLKYQLSYTLV